MQRKRIRASSLRISIKAISRPHQRYEREVFNFSFRSSSGKVGSRVPRDRRTERELARFSARETKRGQG